MKRQWSGSDSIKFLILPMPANSRGTQMSFSMTKPTKWNVWPAKTQISLGIRPVWSESLLSAWRNLGSLATHWVHSKDSDQTGWMPRLIWVFTGCTGQFVIPRHTKSGGVLCYTLQTLSVCPSVRTYVRLSVSASFPCSNFSTFWPIFFKPCTDIGISEEWYGIASVLILFWNNRVIALDICQKCFALHFRALTFVPLYWFSSVFA